MNQIEIRFDQPKSSGASPLRRPAFKNSIFSWTLIPLLFLLTLTSCRSYIDTTLPDRIAKATPGKATQLVFTTSPRSAVAMSALSPSVTVTVEDANGNTITSYADTITLSLGSNPGSAVLAGTLSVKPTLGVATFSNLTIDKIEQGYTLKVY